MAHRSPDSLLKARVLVTRAEERGGPLCSLLRERGATVVHWPSYRVLPGPLKPLRAALARLDEYDWLVVTSAHTVRAIAACRSLPPRRARIAVVGETTGTAVRALGWPVHLRPRTANGAALARALIRHGVRGRRVLYPHSAQAPEDIARALEAAGARVDAVIAYRLAFARRKDGAGEQRRRAAFDAVTFTSPSTIEGLERRLGVPRARALLARTPAVVIGSTTARALARRGFTPARRAHPTTLAGLVDAVERTLGKQRHRLKTSESPP